ncbi:hypothetical protein [Granulicella arctica]|uniref:hypothetical protein n=1 Tax=Granulicella arctica TaxID=940613 RepID=UPI0021E01823|nr:hypothetical protein [Granulicella arctica]
MIAIFTALITVQFLIIALHDLVDVPGWITGSQVQAVMGRRKTILATLANCVFPGIAVALAILFWNQTLPHSVTNYWVIYCGLACLSAVGMWYIPYIRGAPEKLKREYERMYGGTKMLLPSRGDNPRPNLFHMGIHTLFMTNLVLAVFLRL